MQLSDFPPSISRTKLWPLRAASAYLGLSPYQVRTGIAKGQLPFAIQRVGVHDFLDAAQVQAFRVGEADLFQGGAYATA